VSKIQPNENIAVDKVDSKTRFAWMFIHALSKTLEWMVVCATIVALYELAKWSIDWFWHWFGFESQIWQAPVTVVGVIACGASIVFVFDARSEWRRRVRRVAEQEEERVRRAEAALIWKQHRDNLDISTMLLDLEVGQSMSGDKVPDIN